RLRIGMALQLLPLNNPLRIAEEAATVDHISEGRFDFGIGRSGFPRVYDLYGVPYAASQARFREALEIILEALQADAGAGGEADPPGDANVFLPIPFDAAPTEKDPCEEPYESYTFYFSRQ